MNSAFTPVRRAAAATLLTAALGGTALALALAPTAGATGQCLAWFGSRDEGTCLSYSNGSPTLIGTPNVGIWGPNMGISTGPLMPGQTINTPISP